MNRISWLNLLINEFERRCKSNPSYSLRALARDMKLSPSHLHRLMGQKVNPNGKAAYRIAKFLGFSDEETLHFVAKAFEAEEEGKD